MTIKLINILPTNKVLVMFLSFFLLTSCSIFESTDNTVEPTELTDVTNIVNINTTWSEDTGVGNDDALVKLKPIIIDQQIIVIDREGHLSAYDRYKGHTLWENSFETTITGGLAHENNTLFFSDDKAELYAVSVSTGKLLWKEKLGSISLSQTASSGNTVISRTIDGKIYGLDIQTGKQLWIYNRKVPILTFRGNSSPLMLNDTAFVGLDSGKVVAINSKNGQPLWETAITYATGRTDIERMVDIDGELVINGEQLFAASMHGNISAINTATGKINWSRKISSHVGVGYDDKNIYVTDDKDNIWALGQVNGDIIWKQDKISHRLLTTPLSVDGHILVADFDGYIHIISKQTGAIIGRHRLDSSGYLLPAIAKGNEIYWYGNSGQLDMFRVE